MSKKYLFIIFSLWSFALSAATNSPVLSAETENRADPRDSIKTKKATISQLVYLQQLKTLRATPLASNVALANTAHYQNTASFAKSASALERLEVAKRRAFPALNQQLLAHNNFNIPLTANKTEFNEVFINANFNNHLKVDTLIIQAEKSFKELKKLNNSVDVITGKELLELPVGDKILHVPAFYIAYLIRKKQTDDNFFVARVAVNIVAVLTAIPSGGSSLTAVGAISIAVSSADLVMAFSEDHINKLEGGPQFVEFWNYVTLADGVIAFSRLGISATKQAGKITGTIDFAKLKSGIRGANETTLNQIRKISQLLRRMNQLPIETVFSNKVILQIEQSILNQKFSSQIGKTLEFNDGIIATIDNIKIFEIRLASTGGFIKISELKTTTATTDKIIGSLNEIRYVDEAGKIKEGTFNIVKKIDGGVYLVNAGEDIILGNFKILNNDINHVFSKKGFKLINSKKNLNKIKSIVNKSIILSTPMILVKKYTPLWRAIRKYKRGRNKYTSKISISL